jgi:hypothetical protein
MYSTRFVENYSDPVPAAFLEKKFKEWWVPPNKTPNDSLDQSDPEANKGTLGVNPCSEIPSEPLGPGEFRP